jgi:branched-chain amino acid aminotransferase
MEHIPFDKRDGLIWYNGNFVPWQEAKIHVLNHGLHYGSCVYEGIRSYGGKAFKLHEHMERLHNSANILDMTIPYTVDQLVEVVNESLTKQNLSDAYIRPVVWRGSEYMSAGAPNNSINVAIACSAWPPYYSHRVKGITMTIVTKWRKPSPDTVPVHSKASGIYMIATISKHDAMRNGYEEVLFLDYRGYVAEASVANFFAVIDGKLHTPIPDCFLNGLTRQTIISDIAPKIGIEVIERHILPEELQNATEIFITGTAVEVTPVIKLDHKEYPIGPVTKQCFDLYKQLVSM